MNILTAVRETVLGDDGEVGGETANEPDHPAFSVESASEADLVLATGHTRKETLLELVEICEGRVKQVDLVDLTGWSKSTVSRQLSELERDGAITRTQIGRCKIVLLPDKSLGGEHVVSYEAH